MRSVASFIIRASSFITKELVEILRQTRLLLALVLGPFIILLLFGIGYRNEARPLRTIFVIPKDEAQIREQVQQYATTLGPQLDFRGITENRGQALAQLARGDVDAVAVMPDNVEQQIRNSKQPVIQLYHREIDPFQVSYVQYVAEIYVSEVNRRVLQSTVAQEQQQAGSFQQDLQTAKASAHAMRLAYEAGNATEAQSQRGQMNQSLDAVTLALGASLGVMQSAGQSSIPNTGGNSASDIQGTLNDIHQNNQGLDGTSSGSGNNPEQAQRAAKIEEDINKLDTQLQDFRQIDPSVLVSPFKAEAVNVNNIKLNSSDFFTPGVIILLLQHLLVTFAALSIVRERTMGAMELFRVAPVSSFETLLGKYISYIFIGAMLGLIITLLVVFILHVPMLGTWQNYAAVLLGIMFASLGIGFTISLLSETTTQAVQYSMLVLLMSIFFSGFFLDLRLLVPGVRIISWLLPATYGMQMLQEIMFRASGINYLLISGLLGIGVVLFLLSWYLLGRQMRTR